MLYWPRSYGEGLENQKLTKFVLWVGFTPETQTLQLVNAAITIKGITLSITGKLAADAAWKNLNGDILVNIPVIAVDVLPAVWPKVWDSGGRQWLVDRMDKGRFAHIRVNVPVTAAHELVIPISKSPPKLQVNSNRKITGTSIPAPSKAPSITPVSPSITATPCNRRRIRPALACMKVWVSRWISIPPISAG
jgi:hypothetical protein